MDFLTFLAIEPDTHQAPRDSALRTISVFCAAALVRLIYLLVVRPPFETTYWALSTSLMHEGSLALGGARTTDFEPLYPACLALARILSGDRPLVVQVAQCLIASLGAAFLYRLALRLTGHTSLAITAALLFAFDPLLVRQSAAPADSALVTTLLAAFAYFFVAAQDSFGMARAGLVLGLAVLTRSMTLPLAAFVATLLVARRRARAALPLTMAVLLLVVPLVLRNRSVNGSWWPTRSGLNLYIGNSPYTAALLPDYDLDVLEEHAAALVEQELPESTQSTDYDRAADMYLTRHAVAHMVEHPWRTLGQKALNLWYFLGPRLVPRDVMSPDTRAVIQSGGVIVEHARTRPWLEVVSYTAFSGPVLIAAVAGLYLRGRDRSRDGVLWCIAANFVIIHALYFPATRYRAPMEIVLLFYAAVAVHHVLTTRRLRPQNGFVSTSGSD
jgi:4-amino-4-deoxy-L-arabinose transferase-like glycosyltransferase